MVSFLNFFQHFLSNILWILIIGPLAFLALLDFGEPFHVLSPGICVENPNQELPLLLDFSVLDSPHHFVEESLHVAFNPFEFAGLLAHFEEDQLQLLDLVPHVLKP